MQPAAVVTANWWTELVSKSEAGKNAGVTAGQLKVFNDHLSDELSGHLDKAGIVQIWNTKDNLSPILARAALQAGFALHQSWFDAGGYSYSMSCLNRSTVDVRRGIVGKYLPISG